MSRYQRLRSLSIRGVALLMTASGTAWLVNGWLHRSVRRRLHWLADEIPSCEAAIVPGARVHPDGTPSLVLEDRLSAALRLYQAGKVKKILVSGSADAREGDQTEAMRRWLIDRGVADSDILVDPAGRRTRTTMERARRVFGFKQAVVCTQAFHLGRSVFLACRAGMDAVGLAADRRIYRKRRRDRLREFLARQVAFLESYLFRKHSK